MSVFEIKNPNKPTNSTLFFEQTGSTLFIEDGKWFVGNCESQEIADALIAAHNPPTPTEPTVQDKLASVGLSLDDLKVALGL